MNASMADDLQEIDGVGPAREEDLNERGYETYAALAEADAEKLADEIDNMSEDTALELVVQAQSLAELEEAEVEEDPDVAESEDLTDEEVDEELKELEDELEEVEAEAEEEADDGEPEVYSFSLEFDSDKEYDVLYHTLLEERATINRTNRAGQDMYDELLDNLRGEGGDGSLDAELTADGINQLHSSIVQQRIDYQGDNLIDYMDAIDAVENRLNDVRDEHLF